MTDWQIRPATVADAPRIVALNLTNLKATGPMDEARFAAMHANAALSLVVELEGDFAGFFIGFRDGVPHDSQNYAWFADRLSSFFYIDRIVIDARCRGLGIGRALYETARAWAADHSLTFLAAEVNTVPPNPGSTRFHETFGFRRIATHHMGEGRYVAMMLRGVDPGD